MALLLHLSDVHLTAAASEDPVNDAKSAVIHPASQQQPFAKMKTTLERLAAWLRDGDRTLDCIVITGDIAHRNSPGGYERLHLLLEPLVPATVPPERVVVLPGNHDVMKGSPAGSPERYENFLTVRQHGYLTPLLEGVDIHNGSAPAAAPPVLVARDGSFIVVALNSANHSQVQEPPDPALREHLTVLAELRSENAAVGALWESWKRRGEHDPCWVGAEQLQLASDALHKAASDAPRALRIAALHHQLLPVGPVAEIKTFESMSNLGEVLQWVSDNSIDIVLHGHKHVDGVAEANTNPMAFGAPGDDRRVLLVSSPSARPSGTSPLARLIDVPPESARVAGVRLADIRPTGAGGTLAVPWVSHVLDDDVRHGVLRGRTVDDVHRKLLALSKDRVQAYPLLTCVVDDGASALHIPVSYRDAPVPEEEHAAWFESTLDWWQNKAKGTAATFNHGERLRAYGPSGVAEPRDQIKLASDALHRRQSSTRGIAVLIDPTRDLVMGPDEPAFPAFALVQFVIRNSRLDVIGYFRKQEMPHWWPVNVGELARLQQWLVRDVGDGVTPGSITTITPRPVHGGGVPRVSVPSLDQRIDQPSGLLELVLPLFSATRDRNAIRAHWSRAFSDWEPKPEAPADGEPMPIEGLTRLSEMIGDVGSVQGVLPPHSRLIDHLTQLRDACSRRLRASDDDPGRHRAPWLATWNAHRSAVLGLVDELLALHDGAADAAGPPAADQTSGV